MEPLPNYGTHMTMQDFKDACDATAFIDYDGYGYYATETEMTNQVIRPSAMKKGKYNHEFSHIVWFNR